MSLKKGNAGMGPQPMTRVFTYNNIIASRAFKSSTKCRISIARHKDEMIPKRPFLSTSYC